MTARHDSLGFISIWVWLARWIIPGVLVALILFYGTRCDGGIPRDKAQHAAAGAVIYVATYSAARALDVKHPRWWALGVTLAAGVTKELLDRRDPARHSCEVMDAAATLAGGLTVSFVIRF